MAAKFNWKEDFDRARFAITSLSEEGHLSVFFSASALTVQALQALQAYVMTKNFFSSSVGEGGGSIVAKRIQRWHSRESTGTWLPLREIIRILQSLVGGTNPPTSSTPCDKRDGMKSLPDLKNSEFINNFLAHKPAHLKLLFIICFWWPIKAS